MILLPPQGSISLDTEVVMLPYNSRLDNGTFPSVVEVLIPDVQDRT